MTTRKKIPSFVAISALIVLAGTGFLALPSARAQETVSLKLQPAIIEERIDPGKTFASSIRVTNLDSSRKTLYLLTRNISDVLENGEPVFSDNAETYGLKEWVRLSQQSVTLNAGETKEVGFSVNVPQSASPGGHFGGIFASVESPRPGITGAGISYQVGTILALRIGGDVVEEARVREFRTDKRLYSNSSIAFLATAENIGNVLIRPRGPIEVTNMFGKKVGAVVMNDDAASIFPKAKRTFQTSWDAGTYAFGRYQATLALAYGEDGRKTVSSSFSFWVLPMRLIAPVLGGLIIIILIIVTATKFYVKRKLRELQGATPGRPAGGSASYPMPFSRLTFLVIAVTVFILLFLVLLFFLFG